MQVRFLPGAQKSAAVFAPEKAWGRFRAGIEASLSTFSNVLAKKKSSDGYCPRRGRYLAQVFDSEASCQEHQKQKNRSPQANVFLFTPYFFPSIVFSLQKLEYQA
jgi:hypothetical protein